MSVGRFTESDVENATLGTDIAPDAPNAECREYSTVLAGGLHLVLAWLNPDLPASLLDDAFPNSSLAKSALTRLRR